MDTKLKKDKVCEVSILVDNCVNIPLILIGEFTEQHSPSTLFQSAPPLFMGISSRSLQ